MAGSAYGEAVCYDVERVGGVLLIARGIVIDEGRVIVRSDDILGGTPVFARTRVPVRTLFDYLDAGDALDEFPSVSCEQAWAVLALGIEWQKATDRGRI